MANTKQPEGLFITKEELQQLDGLIGNTPTKFGLPIVQFFQLVGQKRQVEAQQAIQKEQEAPAEKAVDDNESF